MYNIPEPVINQVLDPIVRQIRSTPASSHAAPFLLALSGPQGSGKTTWAHSLTTALNDTHALAAIHISLDDLYLPHDGLVRARASGNALFRTRGLPGTHDVRLAEAFFAALRAGDGDVDGANARGGGGGGGGRSGLAVPAFDKSAFAGEGDRVPREAWERVPVGVRVVIFEGWCVGFRDVGAVEVERRWRDARHEADEKDIYPPSMRLSLARRSLGDLIAVDTYLKQYCHGFMGPDKFDWLVQLDTDDLMTVYKWRLEQEHALISVKGSGMKDEDVIRFVEGYMPAYALYQDDLRNHPFFPSSSLNKGHTKLIMNKSREITKLSLHVD